MTHRRHRRVDAKGVEIHVDYEDLDDCNIENISAGGLFIRTPTPMPLGSAVRIDLTKPGFKSSLQVSGKVVSVVTEAESERQAIPPGVGIAFDPMTHETQQRLHALLVELGLTDLAQPTEIEPNLLYATTSPDTSQVAAASNVRGLMDMLSDALQKVRERDEEILKLKAEIRHLKTGAKR